MDWFCIRHVDEKLGFGKDPAIVCIDMTVHAPERGKPNVIFSTYEFAGREGISDRELSYHFHPGTYKTWEQFAFARKVLTTDWKNLKSGGTYQFRLEPGFEHGWTVGVKRRTSARLTRGE